MEEIGSQRGRYFKGKRPGFFQLGSNQQQNKQNKTKDVQEGMSVDLLAAGCICPESVEHVQRCKVLNHHHDEEDQVA